MPCPVHRHTVSFLYPALRFRQHTKSSYCKWTCPLYRDTVSSLYPVYRHTEDTLFSVYRNVTWDTPTVRQASCHCCAHLRGSPLSPYQPCGTETQNYPNAEARCQWEGNVMIAQYHSWLFSCIYHCFVISSLSKLLTFLYIIYIQCMVECGWCFFYIMFIFPPFLFSLKQIFKRRNLLLSIGS